MHDCDLTVSPYNGHMLRNLRKRYLFICCKQSSSTHFCHYLATAFVTDVLAGSNPMKWAQTKTVPFRGPFPIQWWAMRDVACGWRRPHPLRRSAPRVLRWKTLRVSSAPHPGGFESHEMGANKTVPLRGPFPIQWWAMRDSNPQPCACKAPALTVAPIARAEKV